MQCFNWDSCCTQVPLKKVLIWLEVCRNRQTVGKSLLQPPQPQRFSSAAHTVATVTLHNAFLCKTLWRLMFCFLHSTPCVPLWLQTLALKCFNHINLGHCQLHLRHPTQCFCISHLNMFSGRTQAGKNCVHPVLLQDWCRKNLQSCPTDI